MRRSTASPRTKPGKGKVTPVQIAFLVDRYLSDNYFTAALSAFRSDASDLFSKTKGKGVPKGLLSLGDILDDYITLKEQKLALDHEKRKVESLIQGIQDSVRAYQTNVGTPSPPLPQPPLPPPSHPVTANRHVPPPATTSLGAFRPPILPANPKNVASPDNTIQCIPVRKTRISILPNTASEITNNSATTHVQSRSKRRTSNSENVEIQASKKFRVESSNVPAIAGVKLPSQINTANSMEAVPEEKSSSQCKHGSAVRKNLFRQLAESNKLSSPKTPPQSSSSSQSDDSSSPADPPHQSQHSTDTRREMTPSKHSVISSKKIIVISPFKQKGYYSVERSHHVSTSPSKSSPGKVCKRDHVKGRLDFDNSEASPDNGKAVISNCDHVEKTEEDIFDMDLLDLGGDCFSQLLLDFDLDGVDFSSQPSSNSPAKFPHRSSEENEASFVETDQDHSNQLSVAGVLSSEETRIRGLDSMESVQTVTKCIRIVSPVKNPLSLEQDDLNTVNWGTATR